MVIGIVIVIVVGLVAYYHYTQGFFSAGLSAILAVLAAIFAIGWHESLVRLVNNGRFSDQATAMTLIGIFVMSYALCRFIFDKFIPGNLRFPVLLDKIGAGVMGVIAGIATAGIFAIAAQSLPFTETLLWWERYPVAFDKTATISKQNSQQRLDAVFSELDGEKFLNDEANGLLLPVDSWILSLAGIVSAKDGSLDNGKPFAAYHPNYLQELFGQRVGLQAAAHHTSIEGKVGVMGVFTAPQFDQRDQERFEMYAGSGNGTRSKQANATLKPLPPTLKPRPAHMFLVVQVNFDRNIGDIKSGIVAFTPAGVRLCVPSPDDVLGRPAVNYFPIGTLETPTVLFVNQLDDVLFAENSKPVSLVFEVPSKDLSVSSNGERIRDGVFMEFKRLAHNNLSGNEIQSIRKMNVEQGNGMIRREGIAPKTDVATSTESSNPTPVEPTAKDVPLSFDGPVLSDGRFGFSMNIPSSAPNEKEGVADWGTYSTQNRKFSEVDAAVSRTIELMSRGQNLIDSLAPTPGSRVIVVWGRPRADIDDKWAWLQSYREFAVTDSTGSRYAPAGVFTKVINGSGQVMLSARYNPRRIPVDYTPDKAATEARPTDVAIIFVVPEGATITNLMFKTDVAKSLNINP